MQVGLARRKASAIICGYLAYFLMCSLNAAEVAPEAVLSIEDAAQAPSAWSGISLMLRIRNAGTHPLPVPSFQDLFWMGLVATDENKADNGNEDAKIPFLWSVAHYGSPKLRGAELQYRFPPIYLPPGRYSVRLDYSVAGGMKLKSNIIAVGVPMPVKEDEMAERLVKLFSEHAKISLPGHGYEEGLLFSRLGLMAYRNPPAALICFADAYEMMGGACDPQYSMAKKTLLRIIYALSEDEYAAEFGFKPAFLPGEKRVNWLRNEDDPSVLYSSLMLLGSYKPVFDEQNMKALTELLAKYRNSDDGNVRYAAYIATAELFDASKEQKRIWLLEVEAASNISENAKINLRGVLSK